MSEMIERVGKALRVFVGEDEEAMMLPAITYISNRDDQLAMIAIAAMREPTEAMLKAAEREWDGRLSFRCTGAWQAMIDAATTPQPETETLPTKPR